MKKLVSVGAVSAAVLATALVCTAVPASAATQPSVAFVGPVLATPGGVATVKIAYTCSSSPGSMNHLFAAVKQGPQVGPDYPYASSAYAATFYSTNWKSDAGPNALKCDGRQHVQNLVIKPQPGFVAASPRFSSGPALVQLCLYDNVTQFSSDGEPLNGGFAPSYTMENVRVAGR